MAAASCLDARHARAATALQRNKTDARDAETLAQLVRMGWYREARVKSYAAHAVRHLVCARAQLMGIAVDLSNQIRTIGVVMTWRGALFPPMVSAREIKCLRSNPTSYAV